MEKEKKKIPNLMEIRRKEIESKGIPYTTFNRRVDRIGLEQALKFPKIGRGGNYKRFYQLIEEHKEKKGVIAEMQKEKIERE